MSDGDKRVMAWRVTPKQFKAITMAAARHGMTKTQLLNEGLVHELEALGDDRLATRFASDIPPSKEGATAKK